MKYSIDYDNFRVREEANGNYSFLNKTTQKIVFLNKSASYIFNNREINSLNELVVKFKEKYKDISENELMEDCKDILYKMNALGIVSLEDMQEKVLQKVKIAGEEDYKIISEFIKKSIKTKGILLCSSIDLNYYTPYAIRVRQFNNKEYNYMHFNNGVMDALVTISSIASNSSYAISDIFIDNKNIDSTCNILNEIFVYIFNITKNLAKIRIMIKENKESINLINLFEKLNFKKEAILHKEYNNINLLVYSLFREDILDE